MSTRDQIAVETSERLQAATPSLSSIRSTIGYDGFVDEIISVVDKRYALDGFDRVETISHLATKIQSAAGESSNLELVVTMTKLGGNGPIMANALANAGIGVTYIGNLGYPTLHPVFEGMRERAEVFSIAEPGHTDALEFDDGKLMLGKLTPLGDVNWANIRERVGLEQMIEFVDRSDMLAAVNWTMLPHMDGIWDGLLQDVLPKISRKPRLFFFDLADPEKRTVSKLLSALESLKRFMPHGDVVLGLNLKEAGQVAAALGIEGGDRESGIAETARKLRERLELTCVVVHPRSGAAASTASETVQFAGPFVREPKISTGAGDHFNAGFCLGRLLKLPLAHSLCLGTATSGFYVRTAQSPTASDLVGFLGDFPEPEG